MVEGIMLGLLLGVVIRQWALPRLAQRHHQPR
jgi:hypothetical protein